jgi:hypothetical protein
MEDLHVILKNNKDAGLRKSQCAGRLRAHHRQTVWGIVHQAQVAAIFSACWDNFPAWAMALS